MPARVPSNKTKPFDAEMALYGAAHLVVFERVGNPDNCVSAEQLRVVSLIIADIRAWSRTQDAQLVMAYERACTEVLKRAETMVENCRRNAIMRSLYGSIPKPPLPEKNDKAA